MLIKNNLCRGILDIYLVIKTEPTQSPRFKIEFQCVPLWNFNFLKKKCSLVTIYHFSTSRIANSIIYACSYKKLLMMGFPVNTNTALQG